MIGTSRLFGEKSPDGLHILEGLVYGFLHISLVLYCKFLKVNQFILLEFRTIKTKGPQQDSK